MVLNLEKKLYILKVSNFSVEKRISMLTGFKVPSLTRKCVFFKPEHNGKGNPIELNFSRP